MRQRIRWAKGHLQAFVETGGKLFLHIFYTGGAANKDVPETTSKFKRFVNNLRLRFMSFDMLTVVFPYGFWCAAKKLVAYLLRIGIVLTSSSTFGLGLAAGFLENILKLFGINKINFSNDFLAVLWVIVCALSWSAYSYFKGMFTAIYVFILEHKRIINIKWYRKLWYIITFPIFDLIGKLSTFIALFSKVEWKPIPHKESINIDEFKEETSV